MLPRRRLSLSLALLALGAWVATGVAVAQEADLDDTFPVHRERVLEGIRDQLAGQKAARHGRIDVKEDVIQSALQPDALGIDMEEAEKVDDETSEIIGEIDLRQVG